MNRVTTYASGAVGQLRLSGFLGLILFTMLAAAPACTPEGPRRGESRFDNDVGDSGDAGDINVDGGDAEVEPESCDGIEPVAGPAERCCEGFGIDACGPGLFCAAYDGREFAACYAEHSRADGESCKADSECLSYRCNEETERCAASPNASCTLADGCGPGPGTTNFVCAAGTCRASSGAEGQACGAPDDCSSGICFENECVAGRVGDACAAPEHCYLGRCVSGECTDGQRGSECAAAGDCASEICIQGRCYDGSLGEYCTAPSHCLSGNCVDQSCTSGELGSECAGEGTCNAGLSCDRPCSDSQCSSACTDGQVGSPCISDEGCEDALRCTDDTLWRPPGAFFGSLNTCSVGESCSFERQNCQRDNEVCLRTSEGEFCGTPGTGANRSSCDEDADCSSGVCEDHGEGVMECASPGRWGTPCEVGAANACANNHLCVGSGSSSYGQCALRSGYICSMSYEGTTVFRYAGCADGGLEGCLPDRLGRKRCENNLTMFCESDAECGGSRCVMANSCQ